MSHRESAPPNPANAPSARFFSAVGIAPGMRVLDVGCGNGDLSRLLAGLVGAGGEVVGIDRTAEVLAAARSVPSPPKAGALAFHAADLDGALPELGLFDAIVGRRVLMYLADAAATLDRLLCMARPGTILAFQEHARAPLPAGVSPHPAHRLCYDLCWDTVAAEGGDIALGYRLAAIMRNAGIAIEQARSEGVLLQPWEEPFLPTLMNIMLPRMMEQGVVEEGELDLGTLASRIADEQRTSHGAILWDQAFLVAGKFSRAA